LEFILILRIPAKLFQPHDKNTSICEAAQPLRREQSTEAQSGVLISQRRSIR